VVLLFVSLADGRSPIHSKWKKNDISYSINNTGSGMQEDETRNAIITAFALYAAVTPLTFYELQSGGDIQFSFETGSHGDGHSFDGKGETVAHAYYPATALNGDIRFDADEDWTVMNATNLPVTSTSSRK
ncbi:hypothetical protein PMAYCL1PPCAC_22098, partial [Pristionchus mayeri]